MYLICLWNLLNDLANYHGAHCNHMALNNHHSCGKHGAINSFTEQCTYVCPSPRAATFPETFRESGADDRLGRLKYKTYVHIWITEFSDFVQRLAFSRIQRFENWIHFFPQVRGWCLLPDDRNRSSFQNIAFFRTPDNGKVQTTSNGKCYTRPRHSSSG
jgi:hypothetical protein